MSDSTKFTPKKHLETQLHGVNNTSDPKPKKLLDQVRESLRTKHYSYRTEQTYIDWIKRYIIFHKKQHPKDLGVKEIRAFIAHLATDRKVAISTHTVLAFGARETKHSARFSSSTAPSCDKRLICHPT